METRLKADLHDAICSMRFFFAIFKPCFHINHLVVNLSWRFCNTVIVDLSRSCGLVVRLLWGSCKNSSLVLSIAVILLRKALEYIFRTGNEAVSSSLAKWRVLWNVPYDLQFPWK